MGKKQHQKDKLYLTATEWTELYGGKKSETSGKQTFKKLPFYCCSLSLQPFDNPVCTVEGVTFDLVSIVPYLKKYRHSPVTGKTLGAKDLIKLNFHKNSDGKYHCPVTFKVFNDNTHIVAIRTTGNVYSYEAVDRLNLKTKNFRDLLTDEPFTKADVITLQDPAHPERFDLSTFHYIKNKLTVDEDDKEVHDPSYYLRQINPETKATLEILARDYKQPQGQTSSEPSCEHPSSKNTAHYSTGAVAHSFTSTAARPITHNDPALIDRDVLLYSLVKKKGYVRMHTSLGDLNFELHCDLVPKTCHNFISLCRDGYYSGTSFHRSIKNFMIQGGDPTASGKGGQSTWGQPFKDEFKPSLKHAGRGVLSMANSGPDTNKSQFYITYRSCRHLDGKHTVFGRLVGGLEVLSAMEQVATDEQDKPQDSIVVRRCDVFVNPFQEAEEKLADGESDKQEHAKDMADHPSPSTGVKGHSSQPTKVFRDGVGKYIPKSSSTGVKRSNPGTTTTTEPIKKIRTQLSDFSAW